MFVELPDLQGGHSFVNKRPGLTLALPSEEISLYVLDGSTYFIGQFSAKPVVRYVQFGRWMESFSSAISWDDERPSLPWKQDGGNGKWICEFEVVFRMVDSDHDYRRLSPGKHRKPEVIAISADGCQTFIDNQECSLFHESRKLFLAT